jgi:hypothetical protein
VHWLKRATVTIVEYLHLSLPKYKLALVNRCLQVHVRAPVANSLHMLFMRENKRKLRFTWASLVYLVEYLFVVFAMNKESQTADQLVAIFIPTMPTTKGSRIETFEMYYTKYLVTSSCTGRRQANSNKGKNDPIASTAPEWHKT